MKMWGGAPYEGICRVILELFRVGGGDCSV